METHINTVGLINIRRFSIIFCGPQTPDPYNQVRPVIASDLLHELRKMVGWVVQTLKILTNCEESTRFGEILKVRAFVIKIRTE